MSQFNVNHLRDEFPELYAAGLKYFDSFLVREYKDREAFSQAKKVELAQSNGYADLEGWVRGLEYHRGTAYMFGVAAFVAVYGRKPDSTGDDEEISGFLKALREERNKALRLI